MDVGYKHRSGIRGKIPMPFYRTPKPTAAPVAPPVVQAVAKAFKAAAPEMKPNKKEAVAGFDVHVEKLRGGDTGASEVDQRAARYILSVQERLRRERISEEDYWR